MNPYALLIIVLTVAVAFAVVVALSRQGHPEDSAGHGGRLDDPESDTMLRAPGDRPGGPGQAGQHIVTPGQVAPGDPRTRS